MKVYVVSKKTIVYALAALAVVIAAIIIAIIAGGSGSGAHEIKKQPDAAVEENSTQKKDELQLVDTSAGRVEEYELAVFAGLMKEVPVYSVQRDDKKIALTIDAAWQDDKTPFILSTLEKYNVKATFFLCGFWAKDYPDMVREIAAGGHEIGNHSMTHPHMNKLSSSEIKQELDAFEAVIEPLIGKRARLFRAPFGEYNDNVINTLRENGYQVVQWNIDTIDWKEERSAQTILDSVLPKLESGSIILSHNNGYKIEQYLPTLIETALSQGYEFVTVSELLLEGNTLIDVNGVQKQAE